MTDAMVGRIEWLEIREVWKNEAADFTPWLLKNVDVLRDALGGLEIELEKAEHPVGTFSLDLIGRDLTHGATLIVENQIETSDHGHLGQLLTYAAGTDAGTVVWVAKSFRDEHRVALDWLNEHTGEGTRFFGLVVRALRVAESPPAPFLELAVQPNDWQKSVRQVAAGPESAEAVAYREFWAPLRELLSQRDPELLKGRAAPRSIWLGLNSPIPQTTIYGEIGAGELRACLEMNANDRTANVLLLGRLADHRAALEEELGELDFLEGKLRCKIVKREPWEGRLLTQPARHDEARAWFDENLSGLRRSVEAIAPKITSA
jgi:hypothetical protein